MRQLSEQQKSILGGRGPNSGRMENISKCGLQQTVKYLADMQDAFLLNIDACAAQF
jgi:hypothetical protein